MDNEFQIDSHHFFKHNESNDRLGFIRKVYGILTMQLLLTSFFVLIGVLSEEYRVFLLVNFWVIILCALFSIITMIMLVCCKSMARRVPTNYILLTVFTLCEAVMVSSVTLAYDPVTILIAALLTFGLTFVLTAYACFTKRDLTMKMGIAIIFLFALSMFAILFSILYHSRAVEIAVCTVFVIIYGVYLLIDTQLIVGKGRFGLTMDDYIIGALMIYVDMIGLFLYLLRLLGAIRR
jgi:FtsH-binding integral membrane protein